MISDKNDRISYLRAKVINSLINVSIRLYKEKIDDILIGNLDQSLLSIFKKENKTLQDIIKENKIQTNQIKLVPVDSNEVLIYDIQEI